MHAIEFHGVSHRYGTRLAVDRVQLEIPQGALLGLLGPNGAGKTTCLNMMTTLLRPSTGSISVCGLDTVRDAMAVRQRIGYAPEEPLVYSGLTPREFIVLSARVHGMDGGACERAATEQLESFGLTERGDDPIATFSKGMRRKTLLAAAMAHDPQVLVLDEPLEGLDVFSQAKLKDLLRQRVARGRTVVYSSHTIEVVEVLCTDVALLAEGKLVASGPVAQIKEQFGVGSLLDAFGAAN